MTPGDLFLNTLAITCAVAIGTFLAIVLGGLAMRIFRSADTLMEAAWFYVQRRRREAEKR